MMGKSMYKTYTDLTNVVICVSNGIQQPVDKKHAMLVNVHLDSTMPSPSAEDDVHTVGVMLKCLHVLTHTPGWTPSYMSDDPEFYTCNMSIYSILSASVH